MRWRRQSEREFMREMLLRMERSEREHRRALKALHESQRELIDDMHEFRAESREAREEARAEWEVIRKGLLAILDRLEPGDATA